MLSNEKVLEAIRTVRIEGPAIALVNIPITLRSELLSSLDLTRVVFTDERDKLAISSVYFSFWCGNRLHPDYQPPSIIKTFSDTDLETLGVMRKPLDQEEVKASFKGGSYVIDLMKGSQIYASVAFGYLRDHSFELRHCDWICTSLIVGIWKKQDEHRIYTKSGSIYRADLPVHYVQLPLEKLPMLRKGLSPAQIEIVEKLGQTR